jgi:hypothetical protein
MFERGVDHYTSGTATVVVHFPDDQTACRWCPYLRYDRGCNRHWCELTDHLVYNIDNLERSEFCPIVFKNFEED